MYTNTYIYIYIYINTAYPTRSDIFQSSNTKLVALFSIYIYTCIYVYIYKYIHIYIYVYIYIYICIYIHIYMYIYKPKARSSILNETKKTYEL